MNYDLEIYKINESFLKIKCNMGISQEISDYFSFYVPGYKFHPKVKARIWDGIIRIYSVYDNKLPVGLLKRLIKFCKQKDYSYNIDFDNSICDIDKNLVKKYVEDLNLHSRNQKITARDYQLLGLFITLAIKRTILLSSTSSGKSLIIYLICRYLQDNKNLKGLIIVPTVSLCRQLETDFQDYSSHNNYDAYENIHTIFSGKEKLTEKPLTISTWQSLYTIKEQSLYTIKDKKFFEQFDFVINDEAHLSQAASITNIINNCINASYKIGLTGTLSGSKTHENVLCGLFGEPIKLTTTRDLIEKKQISDLKIKCLVLKYKTDFKKLKYIDEIKFLIKNKERNNFIKNLVLSTDKNTLLLFQFVENHGKVLYELISNSSSLNNRKVFFIHGGIESDERERIRTIVEKEKDAIIIASNGVFSTGVNIKNLHYIIFANPSKSRIKTLQSIGRGLRLNEGKEYAVLYDIVDDLSNNKQEQNYALQHFFERVKFYNQEKFEYKTYNVEFNELNLSSTTY